MAMTGARRSWWKTHFTEESLAGYGLESKTRAEVLGVRRLLGLRRGMSLLDLGCGAGRHAIPLAREGLRVTGLDYSRELLARARAAAGADRNSPPAPGLRFERGDMRRLRHHGRFDAAVSLFTSFGYFPDESDDLRTLRAVRRALKPGGALLLDLLNKEWLMRHFTPRFRQREPGGVGRSYLNRLSFDLSAGRLENRRLVIGPGRRRRETFLSFRVYALTELRRLLSEAGLRFERVYGGFDGRAYDMDTFRMIVVSRKPRRGSSLLPQSRPLTHRPKRGRDGRAPPSTPSPARSPRRGPRRRRSPRR